MIGDSKPHRGSQEAVMKWLEGTETMRQIDTSLRHHIHVSLHILLLCFQLTLHRKTRIHFQSNEILKHHFIFLYSPKIRR